MFKKFKNKKEKRVERTNSIIGPGTEFKGILKDKESIRIDGKFEGEIQTEGSVTIGENATVQADIKAGAVAIAGKLIGDITCEGRVKIFSTGSLEGKVTAFDLTIAEGASFNGECRMNPSAGTLDEEKIVTREEE